MYCDLGKVSEGGRFKKNKTRRAMPVHGGLPGTVSRAKAKQEEASPRNLIHVFSEEPPVLLATSTSYLRTSTERYTATMSCPALLPKVVVVVLVVVVVVAVVVVVVVINNNNNNIISSLLSGPSEGPFSEVCFRADAPWAPFRRLGEWMAPPGKDDLEVLHYP